MNMHLVACIKKYINRINSNSSLNIKKNLIIIYASTYIFLSILFLITLYKPIINTFFEDDLLWFIPIFSFKISLSFLNKLYFIFAPNVSSLTLPLWKMCVFSILSLFGPQAKYFIFVSLLFHFINSGLVFLLGKKIGFDKRACFFSMLMYLTLYVHYQAYIWPAAFQHLVVTFFILLVLYFYLKTNELINNNGRYRSLYYILTLVLGLLASLTRGSILILPVLILSHIIFSAKDGEERIKKYDLWLPLLVISLVYPLLAIVFGSEDSLPVSIRFYKSLHFITGLNPWLKFALSIVLITVLSLIFPRFILCIYQKIQVKFKKTQKLEKILRWSIVLIIALSAVFFLLRVLKDMVVFAGLGQFIKGIPIFICILSSFISPLLLSLNSNNIFERNVINLNVDICYALLAFLVIALFLKYFRHRNKITLILLSLWFFTMAAYPGTQLTGSRYLIYITPVFALIFCSAITQLFDSLKGKYIANPVVKELFLIVFFMIFFISNIVAIRVELFRHRLTKNFFLYDYIRMAQLIKDDLSTVNDKKIIPENIYINNVKPLPYEEERQRAVSYDRPYSGDNIRYVFVQVFNRRSMLNIRINQELPKKGDNFSYFVKGQAILNKDGKDIDSFSYLLNEAKKQIAQKNLSRAEDLLKEAQRKRPFLLRFLLGELPEKDLVWITNGKELHSWIDTIVDNHIRWFYFLSDEKIEYIRRLMHDEINEYLQCIFFRAYLAHILGKESCDYSHFLELMTTEEISSLGYVELIASDTYMLSFLNVFKKYRTLKPYQRSGFNLINVSFIRFIIARLFLL